MPRDTIKLDSFALLKAVTNRLLPTVEQDGTTHTALLTCPLSKANLPAEMEVWEHQTRSRALRSQGRSANGVATRWPDDHQIALRVPYAGFVLHGEAHLAVGDSIVLCPRNYFVLFPPNTPMPDGTLPHRERNDRPEAQNSDIFWIKFWPYGVECHICHTRGDKHLGGGFGERAFIADRTFSLLGETLQEELFARRDRYEELSRHYLLSILLLLRRHLQNDESLPQRPQNSSLLSTHDIPSAGHIDSAANIVQRAQEYIHDNLGRPLTIHSIAHGTFTSRAHLAKIFRERTGQTVWEYVTAQRIEEAKRMLSQSNVAVEQIGRIVGFPNSSHFTTRFSRVVGMLPSEFRCRDSLPQKRTREVKPLQKRANFRRLKNHLDDTKV